MEEGSKNLSKVNLNLTDVMGRDIRGTSVYIKKKVKKNKKTRKKRQGIPGKTQKGMALLSKGRGSGESGLAKYFLSLTCRRARHRRMKGKRRTTRLCDTSRRAELRGEVLSGGLRK